MNDRKVTVNFVIKWGMNRMVRTQWMVILGTQSPTAHVTSIRNVSMCRMFEDLAYPRSSIPCVSVVLCVVWVSYNCDMCIYSFVYNIFIIIVAVADEGWRRECGGASEAGGGGAGADSEDHPVKTTSPGLLWSPAPPALPRPAPGHGTTIMWVYIYLYTLVNL